MLGPSSGLFVSRSAQFQLVIDQIVERNDGTNQGTQIDCHQLVICLQVVRINKFWLGHIRQQVEHLLDVVDNCMIDWESSAGNFA